MCLCIFWKFRCAYGQKFSNICFDCALAEFLKFTVNSNQSHNQSVFMHSSVVWSAWSNIAGRLLFISFLHAEYFTEIKQINGLCRATRFAFQSGYTIFPLHIFLIAVFFLFASFPSFYFSLRYFHFSMWCMHFDFDRSLHKYSLIVSSNDICLRFYGFAWKYGNANFMHINWKLKSFLFFSFFFVNYLFITMCKLYFHIWSHTFLAVCACAMCICVKCVYVCVCVCLWMTVSM